MQYFASHENASLLKRPSRWLFLHYTEIADKHSCHIRNDLLWLPVCWLCARRLMSDCKFIDVFSILFFHFCVQCTLCAIISYHSIPFVCSLVIYIYIYCSLHAHYCRQNNSISSLPLCKMCIPSTGMRSRSKLKRFYLVKTHQNALLFSIYFPTDSSCICQCWARDVPMLNAFFHRHRRRRRRCSSS